MPATIIEINTAPGFTTAIEKQKVSSPRVSRRYVAERWGKGNLKRHQMIPLLAADWQWEPGIVPCYTVPVTQVADAEAQDGFSEWLMKRGGTVPTETIGQQFGREEKSRVESRRWARNMQGETTFFELRDAEGEDTSPSVVDYSEFTTGNLELTGGDKHLTSREEIQIAFTYPLHNPVTLTFRSPGGFTYADFWKAVFDGYTKIYAEEGEPDQAVREASMSYNRPATTGKYGIWGHEIGDLFLEGFRELESGVFELSIGS